MFCGKANSLVLLRNGIPTAFDLEYIDRKAKKKDEGSRRKDRPTSRQEHRTFIKENKLTNKHTKEKR